MLSRSWLIPAVWYRATVEAGKRGREEEGSNSGLSKQISPPCRESLIHPVSRAAKRAEPVGVRWCPLGCSRFWHSRCHQTLFAYQHLRHNPIVIAETYGYHVKPPQPTAVGFRLSCRHRGGGFTYRLGWMCLYTCPDTRSDRKNLESPSAFWMRVGIITACTTTLQSPDPARKIVRILADQYVCPCSDILRRNTSFAEIHPVSGQGCVYKARQKQDKSKHTCAHISPSNPGSRAHVEPRWDCEGEGEWPRGS